MSVEPEFLNQISTREFNDMDSNHDGEIDREEFQTYVAKKYKMQGEEVDTIVGDFDDQDLDHDGKLSYEEYQKAVKTGVLNYIREFC